MFIVLYLDRYSSLLFFLLLCLYLCIHVCMLPYIFFFIHHFLWFYHLLLSKDLYNDLWCCGVNLLSRHTTMHMQCTSVENILWAIKTNRRQMCIVFKLICDYWCLWWYRRHKHPFRILWQLVQVFRSCDTPYFAVLHWNSWSPLYSSVSTTMLHCDISVSYTHLTLPTIYSV